MNVIPSVFLRTELTQAPITLLLREIHVQYRNNKIERQENVRNTKWGYRRGTTLERRADYEDNGLLKVGERDKENISKASEQSKYENKLPNMTTTDEVTGFWGEVEVEGVHLNKRSSKGLSMFQLYTFYSAPFDANERGPHLGRSRLLSVRLFRIPIGAGVVNHSYFMASMHSLGEGNLCAPSLSVAWTDTMIGCVHGIAVLICESLDALPVGRSGGVGCRRRRLEGGDETWWQLCGVERGIRHPRVVIRGLETCI